MGYALEQYDFRAWWVYVVGTLVFEAVYLGRAFSVPLPKALVTSLAANFLSAILCTNICGVGLHGGGINPNPLLNMVGTFLGFAAVSGFIESYPWWVLVRKTMPGKDMTVLGKTLLAHYLWVPIGVVIMLVPSRPYPLAEVYSLRTRSYVVQPSLRKAIENQRHYDSLEALLRGENPDNPDAWACAYVPQWDRFSMGETKKHPMEYNPAIKNLDFYKLGGDQAVWLVRYRGCGRVEGWVWKNGSVQLTRKPSILGYAR